jgi:hypothetical protein
MKRLIKCVPKGSVLRMALLGAIFLGLLGCGYPTIKKSPINPDDVLDFVDQNYDRYVITYCGNIDTPTAIKLDLKDNDHMLVGDGWYPVESKSQLGDMIRQMIARYRFYNGVYSGPYLIEIATKDGTVLGYYYSILDAPVVRQDGNRYSVSPISELDIREARRGYSVKGAGG